MKYITPLILAIMLLMSCRTESPYAVRPVAPVNLVAKKPDFSYSHAEATTQYDSTEPSEFETFDEPMYEFVQEDDLLVQEEFIQVEETTVVPTEIVTQNEDELVEPVAEEPVVDAVSVPETDNIVQTSQQEAKVAVIAGSELPDWFVYAVCAMVLGIFCALCVISIERRKYRYYSHRRD